MNQDSGLSTDAGSLSQTPMDDMNAMDAMVPTRGPLLATVTGRVVNKEGDPLPNIKALCCSKNVCYVADTDEDGQYTIGEIDPADSYKMQVADPAGTYSVLYYYQSVVGGETSTLEEDIIMPRRSHDPVPWTKEAGGTVSLLGGELVLSTAADSLEYAPGEIEEVTAVKVDGSDLPPYFETMLPQDHSSIHAYVFNPAPIESSTPVEMRVSTDGLGVEGSRWQLMTLNPDTAQLVVVGRAVVNADGVLVSEENAQILHLITLVLIPSDP